MRHSKAHWQAMADRLVVDSLIRAIHGLDERSIPGKIARDKLDEMARGAYPDLMATIEKEREEWIANANRWLRGVLSPNPRAPLPPGQRRTQVARRKRETRRR